MKPRDDKLPPSRQGKQRLTVWVFLEAHRQIRMIAADLGVSIEKALIEAINEYLVKRGKPPIA